MTSYITNYQVSFKIPNSYLLAAVKDDFKDSVEEQTDTAISIDAYNDVTITGSCYDLVRKAETMIFEQLEANSFVLLIARNLASYLIGTKGERIQQIQQSTKAYIHISRIDGYTSKLEIQGNPQQFRNAKEAIIGKINERIQKQMNSQNPLRSFNMNFLPEGEYYPQYLQDQLNPSPQLFFLVFHGQMKKNEERYCARAADLEKKPPPYISKNSGILAPYEGYMYRAKVLSAEISESADDILLTVLYIDYGNVGEEISYFDCENLEEKFLYPPDATPCQISNIQQDLWGKKSLDLFRKHMKSVCRVKVKFSESSKDSLLELTLSTDGEDIGNMLVDKGDAQWTNPPFDPIVKNSRLQNAIGSADLLYECDGYGGILTVDILALLRDSENFTIPADMDGAYNAFTEAYSCSKKILESQSCNFLDNHTLHFSHQKELQLHGDSVGAAIALCIVSRGLKLRIPAEIAITGKINRNGEVIAVSKLREKLLAAHSHKKKVFYIPMDNLNEASLIRTDIVVKPIKDIFQVIRQIWNFI